MKKYTKPAIEVVEANLSANCLQTLSNTGGDGIQRSPGKKDVDDEDDFGIEDW